MRKPLLYLLFFTILLVGCTNGYEEIVVLPKGFKGYVLVIFNQKSGTPKSYHDGSRIYKIPRNGILKSQFEGNYGWRKPPEYYYEEISKNNLLPSYLEENKISANGVIAIMGSNGNANKDLAGKETVEFTFFYVGTKSEIEQYKEQAEKLDIIKLAE